MMNRIIIVGPGASGKDYLRKILEKKGYRYAINHTSRPIRKGEIEGVDNFYITKKEFSQKIKDNYFYTYQNFNNWYYGISIKEFNKSSLLVLSPSALKNLQAEDRINSLVIYLDCEENIRYKRLLERKDADNAMRRIISDQNDFKNFTNYDLKIDKFNANEFNRIL